MRTISVPLGTNSYEVLVGAGHLAQAGSLLKEKGFSGKLVLITDPTVKKLYGDALAQRLTQDSFSVTTLLVLEGEAQKSLETAGRLYQQLTDARAERGTPVLALGGGVIGDLSGFVAATYMRGVPLVQMPTTLLAQVDASIGGKVAVDHGLLKNKIGTFYQPRLVLSDVDTLKTLPPREIANGLAEVIKTAAIRSQELFAYLEANIERAKTMDMAVLEEIVAQCARIKAEVVAQDERDLGLRAILNFGHTIGHAVESTTDFKVPHGGAVAIGMVAAARISQKMGGLDKSGLVRLKNLLEKAGLPTTMPHLDVENTIQAMQYDKKVQLAKVRFVLLKAIGEAFITDEVSPYLVREVLLSAPPEA